MVSKAKDDFPEPETPVTTVRVLWGISKSTFFRLWTRAPRTTMLSFDIRKRPSPAALRKVREAEGNLQLYLLEPGLAGAPARAMSLSALKETSAGKMLRAPSHFGN